MYQSILFTSQIKSNVCEKTSVQKNIQKHKSLGMKIIFKPRNNWVSRWSFSASCRFYNQETEVFFLWKRKSCDALVVASPVSGTIHWQSEQSFTMGLRNSDTSLQLPCLTPLNTVLTNKYMYYTSRGLFTTVSGQLGIVHSSTGWYCTTQHKMCET